jgi:hypothetical protein
MGFLRRLLGGDPAPPAETPATGASGVVDPATADAEERTRELELLREDEGRLDELTRRQLRYADYAWEPPAQGGERRADDADDRGDEA